MRPGLEASAGPRDRRRKDVVGHVSGVAGFGFGGYVFAKEKSVGIGRLGSGISARGTGSMFLSGGVRVRRRSEGRGGECAGAWLGGEGKPGGEGMPGGGLAGARPRPGRAAVAHELDLTGTAVDGGSFAGALLETSGTRPGRARVARAALARGMGSAGPAVQSPGSREQGSLYGLGAVAGDAVMGAKGGEGGGWRFCGSCPTAHNCSFGPCAWQMEAEVLAVKDE